MRNGEFMRKYKRNIQDDRGNMDGKGAKKHVRRAEFFPIGRGVAARCARSAGDRAAGRPFPTLGDDGERERAGCLGANLLASDSTGLCRDFSETITLCAGYFIPACGKVRESGLR